MEHVSAAAFLTAGQSDPYVLYRGMHSHAECQPSPTVGNICTFFMRARKAQAMYDRRLPALFLRTVHTAIVRFAVLPLLYTYPPHKAELGRPFSLYIFRLVMGYAGYAPAKLPTELTPFQQALKRIPSLDSCAPLLVLPCQPLQVGRTVIQHLPGVSLRSSFLRLQ